MSGLLVDDRYRGAHGIGRYAREVLGRLDRDWRGLGLDGTPYSPFDAFRALPDLAAGSVVYSPGYGALVRAPRQVLTIHDLIQLESPWPGRAKFLAYYGGPVRRVVRRAGIVLTVSETSAEAIRRWLRDDAVDVVNAGNGCSAAFTPDGPREVASDPYVLFVGNVRVHKNLDVVLRALAVTSGIRLRAVVPAGESDQVRQAAERHGVEARVDVVSGVDDARLAELYRGAAATVMPSLLEGFGLPALESVASGTPVIHWAGCRAVAEIVDGRGPAMTDAHDAHEWAAAMTDAAASPRAVDPPPGTYDWDRTAGIVSATLARAGG
ncbi:glycosyltransferase [Microbacterium sp. 77mftsu3.1]|uniref:glycosyltransferase n=1 Tax=Microbacterium sp. 77mftsu3.1 TaxID=1761802 RepID=UPI000360FAE7|nr:glycosyltransferase [Microbacterium sp. 77mftsu3.1]SDG69576.1 Glycosyltransferase involved in cell wall bisynthesis [Microbacterium sp. 77mftsu3.1]